MSIVVVYHFEERTQEEPLAMERKRDGFGDR